MSVNDRVVIPSEVRDRAIALYKEFTEREGAIFQQPGEPYSGT